MKKLWMQAFGWPLFRDCGTFGRSKNGFSGFGGGVARSYFQKQCLMLLAFFALLCPLASGAETNQRIFVIGQDIQSICDYMDAQRKPGSERNLPDGFMVYTAINDLGGLWEPVDHGAGINHADQLMKDYPQMHVIQIGLYMKDSLEQTLQGRYDENIDKLGDWIRKSGKEVYLRIGYEFDNLENEYDPAQYQQVYRRIVDLLRAKGVSNVHFVWHTIAWRDKDWPAYDPMKWYPGDAYVDWVGISFFDSEQYQERDAAAEMAMKIHKPLMIAESSPFFRSSDDEKSEWIKKLFEYIKRHDVRFLSYINVNWDALPMFESKKWGDGRLQLRPELLGQWLREIESIKKQPAAVEHV